MTIALLLTLAAAFLAFANGANDNFKGVATLFGSGLSSYRRALAWATVMTLAGSLASLVLAQGLLHKFSGMGLVPAPLTTSSSFALAVAVGAALTVIVATRLGFPVSTTHAILGALAGAGWTAAGPEALNLHALEKGFVFPLLFSPIVAIALGATAYLLFRLARRLPWVSRPRCVCVDLAGRADAVTVGSGAASLALARSIEVAALPATECAGGRPGVLAVDSSKLMNGLHWLSGGAVSFARGVNDTPKMAALLRAFQVFAPNASTGLVAAGIALGGVIAANRVAETMSHRITDLDPTEALASNLSTAALVLSASVFGLPVSTTHVAVGSLFGIGVANQQANVRTITGIVLSWVLTVPVAVVAGAVTYAMVRRLGV